MDFQQIIDHHKATGATYDLAAGTSTDLAMAQMGADLDLLKTLGRDEKSEKEALLWLFNAGTVIQAVRDLGQVSVSHLLGINQAVLSSKLPLLKAHNYYYMAAISKLVKLTEEAE